MYYKSKYLSPLGIITIASDENDIIGLWFDGQKYYEDNLNIDFTMETKPIIKCKKWLDEYFDGNHPNISSLPLNPVGNRFRKCVWQILVEIPYGTTTTYKAVALETANRLGKNSMSAQAVGGAISHNPISIIIPCHRVVSSNGSLTGYAGGIDKKIYLLKHEHVFIDNLHTPK